MRPEMARLTLARKIAAIALTLWKKEERFRRPTTEAASSLSISENPGDPPGLGAAVVANRFVRCSGSRESIHSLLRRSCTVMQYRVSGSILWPSRPGEFHPEPLTDPDVNLTIHPARATQRRLPPSAKTRSSS